jgi:hypothetical protein
VEVCRLNLPIGGSRLATVAPVRRLYCALRVFFAGFASFHSFTATPSVLAASVDQVQAAHMTKAAGASVVDLALPLAALRAGTQPGVKRDF